MARLPIASPKLTQLETPQNYSSRILSDKFLESASQGALVTVLVGMWQEKYPLVKAVQDMAIKAGVHKATIHRAMVDESILTIHQLVMIEKWLEEEFVDRYVEAKRRVVNG